jgi:hypothetical protein
MTPDTRHFPIGFPLPALAVVYGIAAAPPADIPRTPSSFR